MLSRDAALAGVPASVVSSTIQVAGLPAACVISPQVAALTEGVLKTMLLTKLKTVTVVLLLVACAGVGAGGLLYRAQAAAPPTTPKDPERSSVRVAGGRLAPVPAERPREEPVRPHPPGSLLGAPLGEYLTIEGVRLEGGKVETGTLRVDTIDGKKLDKPVTVVVRSLDYRAMTTRAVRLPAKQRCVLKGYESGEMVGMAPAVLAAAKEQGRKDVMPSQAVWHWRSYFVALIVVEPKGLKIDKK
jgi:hypothetical protein